MAERCGHLPSGAKRSHRGQWVAGMKDECWTEEGDGLGKPYMSSLGMSHSKEWSISISDATDVRGGLEILLFNAFGWDIQRNGGICRQAQKETAGRGDGRGPCLPPGGNDKRKGLCQAWRM